jgi:hypothetical protein
MKPISSLALAALFFAVLLACTHADTLPNGHYRCTVEIGAVLLDGRYPLQFSEVPGAIEVSTSPAGAVTGRAVLLDQTFDIKGAVKSRKGYIRVTLAGKVNKQSFHLNATLQGGAFVGTLKLGKLESSCQFDVTATGAVRPEYVLSLAFAPNGTISGPGTLFAARQQVALTTRGRVAGNGKVVLTIKGPKVFLKTTSGRIDGAGITAAKWTAQGFGSLIKGVNLRLAMDPP